jgi:hypothetical protein
MDRALGFFRLLGEAASIVQGVGLVFAGIGLAIGYLAALPTPLTIALGVVGLGLGVLIAGAVLRLGSRQFPRTSKRVIGQIFRSELVNIDGVEFDSCQFENCTFRYRGTAEFAFVHCRINGMTRVDLPRGAAPATVDLLKALTMLDPVFAADWKHQPDEYFRPK